MERAMLYRITLHLARHPLYPEGSDRHGYEIVAPLSKDGKLDRSAWQHAREQCRVRRFWTGLPDRRGHLTRKPGGAGGAQWAIDYDAATSADDEVGFRLDEHRLVAGEYVTITDQLGPHAFRVVSVEGNAGARRSGDSLALVLPHAHGSAIRR
jgi:hypothetical protein